MFAPEEHMDVRIADEISKTSRKICKFLDQSAKNRRRMLKNTRKLSKSLSNERSAVPSADGVSGLARSDRAGINMLL